MELIDILIPLAKATKREAEPLLSQVSRWLKPLRVPHDLIRLFAYALALALLLMRQAEAADLTEREELVYRTVLHIQAQSKQAVSRGQIRNHIIHHNQLTFSERTISRELVSLREKHLVKMLKKTWVAVRVESQDKAA